MYLGDLEIYDVYTYKSSSCDPNVVPAVGIRHRGFRFDDVKDLHENGKYREINVIDAFFWT